jgi:hypothetical protein
LTYAQARHAVEKWQETYFGCEVFTTATTITAAITHAAEQLIDLLTEAVMAADLDCAWCDYDVVPVGFTRAAERAAPGVGEVCDELERASARHDVAKGPGGYLGFSGACRRLVSGDEAVQKQLLTEICWRVFNKRPAFT